jgi:hypothetical protein
MKTLHLPHTHTVGHDSSVGIATGYGLDGPGIESRWGAFKLEQHYWVGDWQFLFLARDAPVVEPFVNITLTSY